MHPRQIVGAVGAVLLALGVFCPLFSAPIVGNISYFANGKGDGTLVLVAAIGALILALLDQAKPAAAIGLASLALVGYVVWQFQAKVGEMQTQMAHDLAGNPFRGIAEGLVNTVQLQWGLGVMVIGALLLLVAPLIHGAEPQRAHSRYA